MSDDKGTVFPIGFAFDMSAGPDGAMWPVMTVAANFAQFTVQFPVDMAEAMVAELPKALTDIVRKCKMADGKVITIAGADALATLKGSRHAQ